MLRAASGAQRCSGRLPHDGVALSLFLQDLKGTTTRHRQGGEGWGAEAHQEQPGARAAAAVPPACCSPRRPAAARAAHPLGRLDPQLVVLLQVHRRIAGRQLGLQLPLLRARHRLAQRRPQEGKHLRRCGKPWVGRACTMLGSAAALPATRQPSRPQCVPRRPARRSFCGRLGSAFLPRACNEHRRTVWGQAERMGGAGPQAVESAWPAPSFSDFPCSTTRQYESQP